MPQENGRISPLHLGPIIVALVLAILMMARGCQQGPFGRRQLVGLSSQQEAQLGAQAFRQVLSESEVIRSGPAVDAVERIGRRLARAAERPEVLEVIKLKPQSFDWEFRLVRSKEVNAFCLPGGKVVVYTGILPVAKTEAGLATVMGHEIGHALAHHGAERMAQQQLVQLGQVAVASSMGDMSPEQRTAIMAAIGIGSRFGFELPFSRKHESEADHIGLILMADAGYDPRQASAFWERMEKLGGHQPAEFASTHPSHERRADQLRHWLSEALPLYEHSNKADGDRLLPTRP